MSDNPGETLRAALDDLGASIRSAPVHVRWAWVFLYTMVFGLWLLLDSDAKPPIWYQETTLSLGDRLLRAWRRLRT